MGEQGREREDIAEAGGNGVPARFVRSAAHAILDFIFPPSCLSCAATLPIGTQRVCDVCWDSIERVSPVHPLYIETREKLVVSGQVESLVSLFVFEKEGAFQHIAHALKYNGYESLGVELGKRLGEAFRVVGEEGDVLIPIPLHKRKFRERGYNQAERIAHGVSMVTSIPVRTDLLRRSRFTQSQTTLTLEERKKNMEAAFEVIPGKEGDVKARTIILIDDVITTGATIVACAATLRDAGALRIVASSAALAS